MSILTDTSIEEILINDREDWEKDTTKSDTNLLIENYVSECLTPVGYDLRVGREYVKMKENVYSNEDLEENQSFIILPHEIVAIETEEFVAMPQNKSLSGLIVSKVSIAEKGLSHISTSLDADYQGSLIITMANLSSRKIELKRKQPFCTVIFVRNEKPATRKCNKHPDSHLKKLYQAWRRKDDATLKVKIFRNIPYIVPTLILICIGIFFLVSDLTEAQVAYLVAAASLSYLILDRIFSKFD